MAAEKRIELHEKLCELLGSRNCYYNPPEDLKMKYPCIIYKKVQSSRKHADDLNYLLFPGYQIIYITRNPDDELIYQIENFGYCQFDRQYASEGIHHFVYTLYNV